MYLRQQDKNKTWRPLNFEIPYSLVKLEIVTSGGLVSYHIFVSSSTQDKEFTLGRAANCDIVVSQNTISREQCRFFYRNEPGFP